MTLHAVEESRPIEERVKTSEDEEGEKNKNLWLVRPGREHLAKESTPCRCSSVFFLRLKRPAGVRCPPVFLHISPVQVEGELYRRFAFSLATGIFADSRT